MLQQMVEAGHQVHLGLRRKLLNNRKIVGMHLRVFFAVDGKDGATYLFEIVGRIENDERIEPGGGNRVWRIRLE